MLRISNITDIKSVPCDSVLIKYFKTANFIIAPILSYLINPCINQGCFSNYLKIAQVIPIFKSGSNDELSSYCPIFLLTHACKIFEKYFYEQ